MRYLSIGLEKASIIVEVDTCHSCFGWHRDQWWKGALWQHPRTGKVHQANSDGRTTCGVKIPFAKPADTHIAVNVS